jgi:tetratricopeptide (TPR) repeat protein
MRPHAPARLRFVLAAAALALASPAYAQSPEDIKSARQMAQEGLAAYQASNFDKAQELFTRARTLYPSAQVIRMLGYSELGLEHWVAAADTLEAALDAKVSPLSKDDKKDVQDQLGKALSHIGTLSVSSKVAGAKVSVDDGDPRALPLDKPIRIAEGTHKLVVTAPGRLDASDDVKVEAGKLTESALDPAEKPKPKPPPPLPPPPPPKPQRKELVPHQREVGMGAVGVGAGFGIAALVTIIEAAQWRSVADDDVMNHGAVCQQSSQKACAFDVARTNQESSNANQLRNVAVGLGVTAGVLGAAGVTLFVLAPKKSPPPPTDSASPPVAPPPAAWLSVKCSTAGAGLSCSGAF